MTSEQEIKDLADKLMIQGLASSMMGAMEMATNILGTEEKIKDNKKRVTNSMVMESDKPKVKQESKQGKEKVDVSENPEEKEKDDSEDVLNDGKTVKELMDEFSK
jgi:hypothetical protein|tara:strand:- start:2856 stop:3170 length:315 start_codon:yes stop_codon:yes gene_type:complete